MDAEPDILRGRWGVDGGRLTHRIILIEVININCKKIFVICMILAVFLSVSAVCASDANETVTQADESADLVAGGDESDLSVSDSDVELESTKLMKASSKISSDTTYLQGSKIDIQILDENNTAIANKKVYIDYRDSIRTKTTDANGHVYFKLQTKGTYVLTYIFNETGYAPIKKTKKITVVDTKTPTIKGYANYIAYVGAKNTYKVILNANGVKLPDKKITFTLNGKTHTKKTNKYGHADLNFNLKKGTYTIKFKFAGDGTMKAISGSGRITVYQGMPTKIKKLSSVVFTNKKTSKFKVKILDARGNILVGKYVGLTINGKKQAVRTDSKGIATFSVTLSTGKYKLICECPKNNVYAASSATYNAKARTGTTVHNGFWLFGADMKRINLKTAAKYGANTIFLNSYAFTLHGKSEVAKFVKTANSLGIKVHIWMELFNDGDGWISPVTSSGAYRYDLFNSFIKEAKSYASVKGVAGIQFDYIRFPGNAYKYKNGVSAINEFTRMACTELHKLNSKLIVSATVMPEPSAMKYYYGQDIATMSKYLDVIVPMVYKGNYGAGTSWIKSVTSQFVKMSNGAQIWTGLQGYRSDSNVNKLPSSEIMNDAYYASLAGATGVIAFRYTLFNWFYFNHI
jgi:hypothetical protein